MNFETIRAWFQRSIGAVREFLAGAALSWAAVPYVLHRRRETENLFILMTLLGLVGNSPIPLRQRLFLLPYVVPQIMSWRRRLALWDDSLEMADLRHIGH